MRAVLSPDFETDLIAPGYCAPRPVCLVVGAGDCADLYDTDSLSCGVDAFLNVLEADPEAIAGGVNFAFDACVILQWLPDLAARVWAAYERGQIVDWAVLDRIAQIEGRTYVKKPSMQALCNAYSVPVPDKQSAARTTFDQYWGEPISAYSAEHLEYLVGDGVSGVALGKLLVGRYSDLLDSAAVLTRRELWLKIISNRGLRTDPMQVERLRTSAEQHLVSLRNIAQTPMSLPGEVLQGTDEFRAVRVNGTRNMLRLRKLVSHAYGGRPPMTRASKNRKSARPFVPQVCTGRDVLEDSGDPYLGSLAEYGEWSSVVNKDLHMLSAPTLHTRFWIANTLRTTSSGPNVQNFRRAAGIRETIVPRPGNCLVSADYTGAELVCAAQSAIDYLGRHDMADKINAGVDLHVLVGADVASLDYDLLLELIASKALQPCGQPYKDFRQFGKIPNFGCLGGMTYAPTLVIYARRMGIHIDLSMAERVLAAWRHKNPDAGALLDWVKCRLPKSGGGFDVPVPGIGVTRKGAPFCAAANTLFQGRAAVMASHAGWALVRDCEQGLLRKLGAFAVNFVHDEWILECPRNRVTEVAVRVRSIILSSAKPYVKDVALDSEVCAMSRWTKNVSPIWVGGELQIQEVCV